MGYFNVPFGNITPRTYWSGGRAAAEAQMSWITGTEIRVWNIDSCNIHEGSCLPDAWLWKV